MIICTENNIPLNAKVYIHATDTCYGFATRFDDENGINIIKEIKGREELKPFSLLFKDFEMLENFCEINKKQKEFILSKKDPSSFILPKREILKDYFPKEKNVCVRIENNNFPVKLSSILKVPVTSTSVNRSSMPPLYNSDEIITEFKNETDNLIFINSENLKKIPSSNIWDLTIFPYKKIR